MTISLIGRWAIAAAFSILLGAQAAASHAAPDADLSAREAGTAKKALILLTPVDCLVTGTQQEENPRPVICPQSGATELQWARAYAPQPPRLAPNRIGDDIADELASLYPAKSTQFALVGDPIDLKDSLQRKGYTLEVNTPGKPPSASAKFLYILAAPSHGTDGLTMLSVHVDGKTWTRLYAGGVAKSAWSVGAGSGS